MGATSFSIPDSHNTVTITLDIIEDNLAEDTETIIATLSNLTTGIMVLFSVQTVQALI